MPQRVVWTCFKADREAREENKKFLDKLREHDGHEHQFDWDLELLKFTEKRTVPRS